MNYKNWIFSMSAILIVSCGELFPKKENKESIVEEEWQKISKTEVDEPPLFNNCLTEEDAELCFQQTISNHIKNYLETQNLQLNEAINDTIWVPILITKEGEIKPETIQIPEKISAQVDNFSTIIKEGLATLPPLKPAHTRGTEVSVKYRLPIIIAID